jgi:NTE family protein
VIKYIAEAFPETRFSIMTGVSAGAINSGQLANHTGTFVEAASDLVEAWTSLNPELVFRQESTFSFMRRLLWYNTQVQAGKDPPPSYNGKRGLIDPTPLRRFLIDRMHTDPDGKLTGVGKNLQVGHLKAFAVTTTNYMTGQTVTFVQGRNIDRWERPNRVGVSTTVSVDHIIASSALPFIFPAIPIGGTWYGDGGVRLSMPLSPALNLGADRILVVSTRYNRTRVEADQPSITGYPPAAQIIGLLVNAIFLDVLDQDAVNLERINRLIAELPPRKRRGLRPVRLHMVRPSVDLGKLAAQFEVRLSGALRLLTLGLGSEETESPDWLSLLLFEPRYTTQLMDIGYHDAHAQHDELEAFLADE